MVLFRASKKRDWKNKKFGFGGQKKRSKSNTKDSYNDSRDFSVSRNSKGAKAKVCVNRSTERTRAKICFNKNSILVRSNMFEVHFYYIQKGLFS